MTLSKSLFPLMVACLLVVPSSLAQLGPLTDPARAPQARTQQEFDHYLQIISTPDPHQIIEQVDAFARTFPDSQLLGNAWQVQMRAFQQLNDFDALLRAGQKALAATPGNLNTLLILAPAVANAAMQRPDRQALLAQARTYATDALTAIDQTKIPRTMPLERWLAEKKKMQSQAHETLGVVALDQTDVATAVHEFESAIALQPADGAAFLRLGLAYAEAQRVDDAKQSLLRAAALGPDAVRTLALSQIRGLSVRNPRPN